MLVGWLALINRITGQLNNQTANLPVLKVGSAGSLEIPEESFGFPQGQESACEATFDVVSIYHTML